MLRRFFNVRRVKRVTQGCASRYISHIPNQVKPIPSSHPLAFENNRSNIGIQDGKEMIWSPSATGVFEESSPFQAWNADTFDPTIYDYHVLTRCESVLKHFIDEYITYGLVRVKNAPCEEGTVKSVGQYLTNGIVCSTFGESVKIVENSHSSNTDTDTDIPMLHTKLPFMENVPGGFISHCIEKKMCGGGESIYVDGYQLIEDLKYEEPQVLEILRRELVCFRDNQATWDIFTWRHIIDLTQEELRHASNANMVTGAPKIYFNESLRYCMRNDRIPDNVYHAKHVLKEKIRDAHYHYVAQTRPGDITVINNHRILCGTNPSKGLVKIETSYFDLQAMCARRNKLKQINPCGEYC